MCECLEVGMRSSCSSVEGLWPMVLLALGLALLWRNHDDSSDEESNDDDSPSTMYS